MQTKVTACLLNWKRPNNIKQIVEQIRKNDFINEVIVHDNTFGENIINYGRYVCAKQAKNDIIYTQDDDCIIYNIGEIYEKFLKEPDKISHGGPEYYKKDIPNNIFRGTQMSLAGWGFIFNRNRINVLDKYIKKYGKDYCFYRETDRIFSILHGGYSNFTRVNMYEFPDAHTDVALSEQPEHIKYKKLAIERALKLYNEN